MEDKFNKVKNELERYKVELNSLKHKKVLKPAQGIQQPSKGLPTVTKIASTNSASEKSKLQPEAKPENVPQKPAPSQLSARSSIKSPNTIPKQIVPQPDQVKAKPM